MPISTSPKLIHVAVGVILDADKQILIALRHPDSHQGGLWEFPGGKVEEGESVQQALARELAEELGLRVNDSRSLVCIEHDYGDKKVMLDVWWVERFEGLAQGREGQPIKWVSARALTDFRFPEANHAIVAAVQQALLV